MFKCPNVLVTHETIYSSKRHEDYCIGQAWISKQHLKKKKKTNNIEKLLQTQIISLCS